MKNLSPFPHLATPQSSSFRRLGNFHIFLCPLSHFFLLGQFFFKFDVQFMCSLCPSRKTPPTHLQHSPIPLLLFSSLLYFTLLYLLIIINPLPEYLPHSQSANRVAAHIFHQLSRKQIFFTIIQFSEFPLSS